MMSAIEKSEASPGIEKPGEGSVVDKFIKEGLEVRGLELRLRVVSGGSQAGKNIPGDRKPKGAEAGMCVAGLRYRRRWSEQGATGLDEV